MARLMDEFSDPVKVELAQIIVGECRDKETAYDTVHRLQQRVDEVLATEFPNLSVSLSAATYGDPQEFDDAADRG